jgi:hypothetical protein
VPYGAILLLPPADVVLRLGIVLIGSVSAAVHDSQGCLADRFNVALPALLLDAALQCWLSCYRYLVDTWRLPSVEGNHSCSA